MCQEEEEEEEEEEAHESYFLPSFRPLFSFRIISTPHRACAPKGKVLLTNHTVPWSAIPFRNRNDKENVLGLILIMVYAIVFIKPNQPLDDAPQQLATRPFDAAFERCR